MSELRKQMTRSLLLLSLFALGCGGSTSTSNPTEVPLTLEAWKQMPTQVKFEIETFERLKLGEPKLREAKAWDQFTRAVILPAKKKEMNK